MAIQLCDVNGSAKSIIEWGCKCNLDKHQRHAFEVITASFVLTYFKNAAKNNERMTTCDNQSVMEKYHFSTVPHYIIYAVPYN